MPDDVADRYRKLGYWTGQTLGDLLRDDDRTAVVDGERQITYAELRERAHRLAAGFAGLGLRRGDRVVVQLPNVAEYFEVIFALFRLGAIYVPTIVGLWMTMLAVLGFYTISRASHLETLRTLAARRASA